MVVAFLLLGATGCLTQSAESVLPPGAIRVDSVPWGKRINPLALSDDGFTAVYSVQGPTDDAGWYLVRDVRTSTTTPLGNTGSPAFGRPAGSAAGSADVSADGRYVAFESRDPSLRPGTTGLNCLLRSPGLSQVHCTEIYVRDMSTGVTVPVTGAASPSIQQENRSPQLSADGRYVTYTVVTTDTFGYTVTEGIGRWDRDTGITEIVQESPLPEVSKWSSDGRYRFDWHDSWDLTATDLTTGVTEVLNNHDTTHLTDVTFDGSAALVLCSEQSPQAWCLVDRVTHARREVPGLPTDGAAINRDATKVLSMRAPGGFVGDTGLLVIWPI